MILSADSDFHCRARRLYFTDMKAVIAQSKGWKRQRHSLGTGVVATRVILDEAAEIGARRQPGRVPPGRGRVVGNGHEGPGHPLRTNAGPISADTSHNIFPSMLRNMVSD